MKEVFRKASALLLAVVMVVSTYTTAYATTGTGSGVLTDVKTNRTSIKGATVTLDAYSIVYTGDYEEPGVTVSIGGNTLSEGTDFKVEYTGNQDVGTATVIITGIGDYSGTEIAFFTIEKATYVLANNGFSENQTVTEGSNAFVFPVFVGVKGETATGSMLYKINNVIWTETELLEYVVTYMSTNESITIDYIFDPDPNLNYKSENYDDIYGSFTVTVREKIETLEFRLDNAAGSTVDASTAVTINNTVYGNVWKDIVSINSNVGAYLGDTKVEGTFSVENGDTIPCAGEQTYRVIFNAADYANVEVFSGTVNVGKKTLAANCIAAISEQTYTGGEVKPTLAVTDGEKPLTLGTDYTVAYSNNVNIGTATATVTGINNYTGTASAAYQITAADIKVSAENLTLSYNGEPQTIVPKINVTTADGQAATIMYRVGESGAFSTEVPQFTNIGEYKVYYRVSAQNHSDTTGNDYFTVTVNRATLTSENIATIDSTTYNGKSQTPAVTVTVGGKTLAEGTDFTVAYEKNKDAGEATVTVTGQGDYAGTATATFTINKAKYVLTPDFNAAQTVLQGEGNFVEPTFVGVNGEVPTGKLFYKINGEEQRFDEIKRTLCDTAPNGVVTVAYFYEPDGNGNYDTTEAIKGSFTVTVAAKHLVFKVGNDAAGAENSVTVSNAVYGNTWNDIVSINDDISAYWGNTKVEGTFSVANGDTKPNAGENQSYKVVFNGMSEGNTFENVVVCTGVTSIARKELTADMISLSANCFVYDGSKQGPTITVSDGDLMKASDYTVTVPDATAAGEYYVSVAATDSGNYSGAISSGDAVRFTITQAPNEITALTIDGWTYGETAETPTAAAKFGSVSYSYSDAENGTYSANVPTNAGTYWVKAAVLATDDYADAEKTAKFTIAPKPIDATILGPESYTYNGSNGGYTHTVTFSGVVHDEVVGYNVLYDNDEAPTEVKGNEDAYELTVELDSANYTLRNTSGVKEFTITQAPNEITALTIKGWTYGETAETPTAAAKFGAVSYSYSNAENGTYSADVPTDAGTYWVKAAVAATKDYAAAEKTVEFTIAPRAVTIEGVVVKDKTHDGDTNAIIDTSVAPTIIGRVGADDLTVIFGTAAFADAESGTEKQVILEGFSLGGDDANNYTLAEQPATTANIIGPNDPVAIVDGARPTDKYIVEKTTATAADLPSDIESAFDNTGVEDNSGKNLWEKVQDALLAKAEKEFPRISDSDIIDLTLKNHGTEVAIPGESVTVFLPYSLFPGCSQNSEFVVTHLLNDGSIEVFSSKMGAAKNIDRLPNGLRFTVTQFSIFLVGYQNPVIPVSPAGFPTTNRIISPKTADAGIVLYVGTALCSALGAAYVMHKKKD